MQPHKLLKIRISGLSTRDPDLLKAQWLLNMLNILKKCAKPIECVCNVAQTYKAIIYSIKEARLTR